VKTEKCSCRSWSRVLAYRKKPEDWLARNPLVGLYDLGQAGPGRVYTILMHKNEVANFESVSCERLRGKGR